MACLLILVAMLLGGASRLDVSTTLAVQWVAIGAIGWLIARSPPGTLTYSRGAIIAWTAILAFPLLQLLPLPWPVWSALGGRDTARALYTAMGERPWHAVSLTPDLTLVAFLALLPPLAAFMLVGLLDADARTRLLRFVLGLGAASAVVGILQFAAGATSVLRFYTVTNRDAGVGAFANANHHALFLCSAIVLAFWWLGDQLAEADDESSRLRPLAGGAALIILLAVAVAAAGSRAGLVLILIAAIGGFGLLPLKGPVLRAIGTAAMILPPLLALGAVVATIAWPGLALVDGADGRAAQLPLLWRMMTDFLPLGSGLGSFAMVYAGYEPFDAVSLTYFNQAHDDYLQLAIEAGIAGLIAILAFVGWWLRAAFQAWLRPGRDEAVVRQQRAAALILGMMLLHSLVDYPLRTTALATLAALLCAMIVAPRAGRPLWDSR